MSQLTLMGVGVPGQEYWQRILTTYGSQIIGYWRFNEASGGTANDSSGNGYNGSISGATPGVTGLGDGSTAFSFDGNNDFVNLYSAGLVGAFDGEEGFLHVMFQVAAGFWAGAQKYMVHLQVNANNYVDISKYASGADNALSARHMAGGTLVGGGGYHNATTPLTVTIVWSLSGNYVRVYINGSSYSDGPTAGRFTGTGTWAGTINSRYCTVGALDSTNPVTCFAGTAGHVILGNAPLTDAQVLDLSSLTTRKRLVFIGDSIEVQNPVTWVNRLYPSYNSGNNAVYNYAAAGHTIVDNMAGDVALAASDDADDVFVCLGTNDGASCQAAYQTSLQTIKSQHPRAAIHCLEVLPRTTNPFGGSADWRSIAIRAAALAEGITSWATDGWIDPTAGVDTTDGTHPNASGHAKIATQVLALL